MIEAKITCTCGGIKIPDVGLNLVKGQVVYMDEARARSSRDLQRAWRAKGVSVQYVQRYREKREAPPTNPVFPVPSGMAAHAPEPVERMSETMLLDPDVIAQRVVDALGPSNLDNRIRAEVGRQLSDLRVQIIHELVREMRVVVREELQRELASLPAAPVVQAARPAPPVGSVSVDDDVPVFIPSKIGRDDLKADIGVSSVEAEEGGLSDAAAALKAARTGKKRRAE